MFAASKSGSAAAPTDAQFNYVTMLLHGDGTNGAQNNTFLDSSTNNFTITRNGNTTQGTFSPYGSNWSNYFDGSSYETVAGSTNLAFGTGDFTIECWVNFNSVSSGNLLDMRPSSTNGAYPNLYVSSGTLAYYVSSSDRITGGTVTVGTWYHIALCRSGTSTKLFLNGTQIGSTYTDSNNYVCGTNRPMIAGNGFSNSANFNAYVSNFRFINGTALYTTSFTPPTTPLTAITNTSLLICQSNRFIDNSASPYTITISGSPSVQRFSPFSPTTAYSTSVIGGSGYFDGSGDSLSSASNFEASTSTTTFTIEGFVYPTTFSSLINIIGGIATTSGDTKSIAAEVNTSGQVALYWYDGAIKRCTGNTIMQLNAWNYFAIVVSSNSISIYVNKTTTDTLSGTTTLTNRTQLQGLGVGAYYNNNTPAQYFNGYLANLRYSTIARTISSLPTTPFASDTNTRWLLSYTNAGILDNAMMNDLETVGNAQISTSVKKYGTGSISFDGSGDNLSVLPSAGALGSGDWTVEFWWQWTSATGDYQTVVSKGIVGGTPANGSWSFGPYQQANNIWFAYYNGGFTDVSASATLNDGAWHHMAASRQGTSLRLFADGVLKVTGTLPSNLDFGPSTTDPFLVGYNSRNARYINGYVDDLRITKGVARYTANFTPPTAPFPDKG